MLRLKTLGARRENHQLDETAERLLESYPDTEGDAATGITLGTLLGGSFLIGLGCGLMIHAIYLFFRHLQ